MLAMSLNQPHLHNPQIFSNDLQKYSQHGIAELLGFKIERPPRNPGKRKCCRTCLEQIKALDQKNKKTVLAKLFTNTSNVVKYFIQTIFKRFVGHASSKQYCSLLFVSKKRLKKDLTMRQ